jgi:hypothetical protein
METELGAYTEFLITLPRAFSVWFSNASSD